MPNSDVDQLRRDQRQDWESVAAGWEKWYKTFENGAYKMSDKLIDMSKVKQASRVLDIATGIGEPAIAVAKTSGYQWSCDGYRHIITNVVNSKKEGHRRALGRNY